MRATMTYPGLEVLFGERVIVLRPGNDLGALIVVLCLALPVDKTAKRLDQDLDGQSHHSEGGRTGSQGCRRCA